MAITDSRRAWYAFSGGEVTPELFGRLDIAEYNTALAKCRNFIVLPHGPIVSRPGTQYVSTTKTGLARLVPFIRGDGEALMLEFGATYVRFHRDGGTVLVPGAEKTISSIAVVAPTADPAVHTFTHEAHEYTDGDLVVLYDVKRNNIPVATGGIYKIDGVTESTPNTFRLLNASGQSIFGTDTDVVLNSTYTGGTVNIASADPFEVETDYTVDELFELKFEQSVDTLTITHPNWRPRELVRGDSDAVWALSDVVFATAVAAPAGTPAVVTSGTTGPLKTYNYVITAVDADGEESTASAVGTVEANTSVAGQFNTITWLEVSGATYNVYKEWAESGRYYFISSALNYSTGVVDDNIIPDFTKAPPEATDPFGTGEDPSSTQPSVVSYFEQRRIFAATDGDLQRFWATRSGFDSNMNASSVPQDDDPFNFRLAARRAHTIRHIIPFSAELLMLTGSALWRVFPDAAGGLTPTNASARVNLEIGATQVRPTAFQNNLLFANNRGEHLISVKFSEEAGGYTSRDLSIGAAHLIDGHYWVQMDFQESPYPIWWGVREDGVLIGVTYSPELAVVAWHQHDLGGVGAVVESVAVIPANDGGDDVVYLIVRRTVNSATVRFVEFLTPRDFPDVEHSFCVDAGLMYDGDATAAVSGLTHLVGESVTALADGVASAHTVSGSGTITLPDSATASVIVVGFGFSAEMQTLPLAYQAEAQGMGQQEVITSVRIRVVDSIGGAAGPIGALVVPDMQDFPLDLDETSTTALRNGILEVVPDFNWDEDSQVKIWQQSALPMTITAIAIDYAKADDVSTANMLGGPTRKR